MTNRSITVLGLLAAMIVISSPARAATIFVDDDAPSDPGPNDNTVSDPLEDGTIAHPFDKIQEGIAAAVSGVDDVEVAPGTYDEAIDFIGKAITVYSSGGAAVTIIDAQGVGTVAAVTCDSGETSLTVLDGLTSRPPTTFWSALVRGHGPKEGDGGAAARQVHRRHAT